MNIFKKIYNENQIFKNEDAFRPDYLPDEILHREQELREIVFSVKALEEQRKQPSILIYGPPGTGKTCTIRYVVKEFSEYTQRAQPIYVNCWQTSTRYAIISKIAQAMDALVPSTGVSIEDLLRRIREASAGAKKVPLVVLDEVDVLQKKNEDAVLYDLLRMGEIYGVGIGLMLITNDVAFVARLDRRIRSSLAQNAVEFAPYGPQQLRDIIRERAKLGLFSGAYNDEIIGMCAGFAAKNGGDARVGIALLWMAGKEAEKNDHEHITIEDVESAKEKVAVAAGGGAKEMKSADTLKDDEKRVFELIKKGGEASSGEIYKKLGMNERTARNYLAKLESLGLIECEEKVLKSGRTRLFRIAKI